MPSAIQDIAEERLKAYSHFPDVLSRGSGLHEAGRCIPCKFLRTVGCDKGPDCPMCHHAHEELTGTAIRRMTRKLVHEAAALRGELRGSVKCHTGKKKKAQKSAPPEGPEVPEDVAEPAAVASTVPEDPIDLDLLCQRLNRQVGFLGTTSVPMPAAAAAAPRGVVRWIVDSGASNHMIGRADVDPDDIFKSQKGITITTANGQLTVWDRVICRVPCFWAFP